MKCEACGYKFLFASSTQCPSCGDPREDIVADGYDFLTANAVPIMDSVVGLKAANAHLTRRLAAQALAHAEQMERAQRQIEVYEVLVRNWATQMQAKDARLAELGAIHVSGTPANRAPPEAVAVNEEQEKIAYWRERALRIESELSAMRVMAATQPTDAQQTASDVKPAPERRPDGTLKPVAPAWEAPKIGNDPRRIGS